MPIVESPFVTSRRSQAQRGLIALLLASLLPVGCGSLSDRERLPGEGAIAAFERHEHWLSVFGGPGVTHAQMLDMEQFGEFLPGMAPEVTGITVGRPDSVRDERAGARYFVYRRPQGVFEIGEEKYAVGGIEGIDYPIYYYPADRRPEAFFSSTIVARLRLDADMETIQVFECGVAQPGVVVLLERGQINQIGWKALTELALRRDSDQCTPWVD